MGGENWCTTKIFKPHSQISRLCGPYAFILFYINYLIELDFLGNLTLMYIVETNL